MVCRRRAAAGRDVLRARIDDRRAALGRSGRGRRRSALLSITGRLGQACHRDRTTELAPLQDCSSGFLDYVSSERKHCAPLWRPEIPLHSCGGDVAVRLPVVTTRAGKKEPRCGLDFASGLYISVD